MGQLLHQVEQPRVSDQGALAHVQGPELGQALGHLLQALVTHSAGRHAQALQLGHAVCQDADPRVTHVVAEGHIQVLDGGDLGPAVHQVAEAAVTNVITGSEVQGLQVLDGGQVLETSITDVHAEAEVQGPQL